MSFDPWRWLADDTAKPHPASRSKTPPGGQDGGRLVKGNRRHTDEGPDSRRNQRDARRSQQHLDDLGINETLPPIELARRTGRDGRSVAARPYADDDHLAKIQGDTADRRHGAATPSAAARYGLKTWSSQFVSRDRIRNGRAVSLDDYRSLEDAHYRRVTGIVERCRNPQAECKAPVYALGRCQACDMYRRRHGGDERPARLVTTTNRKYPPEDA